MNLAKTFSRASPLALLICGSILVFLAACRSVETPTPVVPPPPRATATPVASPTPAPSPTPSDFFVSILNRRLTRPEIVEAIRSEGAVTVGGWNYAARDAVAKQFQEWGKREYGMDIQVQYIAEASPATYLQNIDAARKANNAAPYDVIAVEESYFLEARQSDAAEKMLPSDLLSNVSRVEAAGLHDPYAVPFQSSATVAPIFHNDAIGGWFHDWKDLADPRLRRRITLPKAGDVVAGAFLVGVAGSLGKDYKNSQQMSEAIDFVCTQIYPNALKATNNFSEMQELLRGDRIDAAVTWNLLARLERFSGADGTQDIVFRPMSSGQPAMNGYAWIPKGAPHPVLAQLFINWRLSDDGQLPGDGWDISETAWGDYHEGLLGVSYEAAIPVWAKENYFQVYPTVADMKNLYRPVDWEYYAAHEGEWMEQYGKCVE